MDPAECLDGRFHGAGLGGADADRALELGSRPYFGLGLLDQCQDLLCALAEPHAILGERRRAVRSHEERAAKLILELGNLARECRLRHMQDVGCLCHVLFASDRQEVSEGPYLHIAPRSLAMDGRFCRKHAAIGSGVWIAS